MSLSAHRDLLTTAEEQALISRHQAGDRAATDRLVACNRGLIAQFVGRFRLQSATEREDLIQEGTIGFLTALNRYDASEGTTLATYAMWWIRAAVIRYWRRNGSIVRDISLDRTRLAPQRDVSLDAPIDAVGHTRHEFIEGHAEDAETAKMRTESQDAAIRAMRCLSDRERTVVTRRLMGDDTLRAIGDDLGLSHERVRQIEDIAKRKMRKAMAAWGVLQS